MSNKKEGSPQMYQNQCWDHIYRVLHYYVNGEYYWYIWPTMSRNTTLRVLYATLIPLTMWLGLATRDPDCAFPPLLRIYGGDIFYATFVVFGLRFFFPGVRLWKVVSWGFIFCVCIELQQLIDTPWLDHVRHTFPFGLILGYGFQWSDLVCYGVGSLLGYVVCMIGEMLVLRGEARSR